MLWTVVRLGCCQGLPQTPQEAPSTLLHRQPLGVQCQGLSTPTLKTEESLRMRDKVSSRSSPAPNPSSTSSAVEVFAPGFLLLGLQEVAHSATQGLTKTLQIFSRFQCFSRLNTAFWLIIAFFEADFVYFFLSEAFLKKNISVYSEPH